MQSSKYMNIGPWIQTILFKNHYYVLSVMSGVTYAYYPAFICEDI